MKRAVRVEMKAIMVMAFHARKVKEVKEVAAIAM